MKVLELKLDMSKLNLSEEDKKSTPASIVGDVLKTVIVGYSQQQKGLNQPERKQFYTITDILDKAALDNKDKIELADTEMGFIKKCFRETKLTPNNLLRQVEDLLEK
jgi:hypothetical protein